MQRAVRGRDPVDGGGDVHARLVASVRAPALVAQDRPHPGRPLGEDLVGVLRGRGHDREHLVDEVGGHVLVEEVCH